MLELTGFQSIANNIQEGFIILDEQCNLLVINQKGREILRQLSARLPQSAPPHATTENNHADAPLQIDQIPDLMPLLSPPSRSIIVESENGENPIYGRSQKVELNGQHLIQISLTDTHTSDRSDSNSQLERYKTLLHITSELAYTLEEDLILVRALELLADAIDATEASILLVDEDTGEFTIRSTLIRGAKAQLISHPTGLWPNMGLAGLVLRKRETIAIQDTFNSDDWIQKSVSLVHRSVVGAPLEYGHEGIGVLTLSKSEPHSFTEHEIELVSAAASRISNALYIAHLYDLIRNQAARLGSMLREEQISAAKNQAILESIADGVLVANERGEIILANDAILAILDEPRSRLLGEDINTLSGLYGAASEPWSKTIRDWQIGIGLKERPSLVDRLSLSDSGKEVRVHLSPVFAGGQFFGTVSIFRDVSAEVEADRVKTDFVSRVSHELRTPLTSIKGYADLMLMGATGSLTDKVTQYVQVIKTNANRLHELVGDLLDISQFETGNTVLERKEIELEPLITAVVDHHLSNRIRVENKEMRSEIDLPEALPTVCADRMRLEQILTNLVDNAFNYTPENGKITISAREDQAPNMVVVSVQDTGFGISPDDIEKIFDRFFRASDERVQSISGTGLGLPIVKTLVELHGGTITVRSKPNEGAIFTFGLPIAKVAKDENLSD